MIHQLFDRISEYFSTKSEITTIIVYGSLAEDKITEKSDVDIAVAGNSALSFAEMLDFNRDLQILLKRNVDLIDLNEAKGLIHYKIMTKGIRLKGSDKEITDHLIKAIDFRTDFMPQLMEMQKKRIERSIYGT